MESPPQLLMLWFREHGGRDNRGKSRGEANATEEIHPWEGFRLRSEQKGIKEPDRNLGRLINPAVF